MDYQIHKLYWVKQEYSAQQMLSSTWLSWVEFILVVLKVNLVISFDFGQAEQNNDK
jgi:hypothetical protein